MIPFAWRLGVLAAALSVSFGAGYTTASGRAEKGRLRAAVAQRDTVRAAELAADALRADLARKDLEVRNALHAKTRRNRAIAATARADADGLRSTLAAIGASAGDAAASGCEPERTVILGLARLLDESASLVTEGAERGDSAAAALEALRARDTILHVSP